MPEILFPKKPETSSVGYQEDFENEITKFVKKDSLLSTLTIAEITEIFNQISKNWHSKESKVYDLFILYNLGFLIGWLKKKNINELISLSLKEPKFLDGPVKIGGKKMLAAPKGTVVHWIAGNVPLLGILSLFQGLLTKNKNIVKVPSSFKMVLPKLIENVASQSFSIGNRNISGKVLTDAVMVVYVDKEDINGQSIISRLADVRYAWGGKEAIDAIIGLDRKIECEDVIMGPKLSLSVISKEFLNDTDSALEVSSKITNDVFAFDQRGCNAPHNIYIESGGKINIDEFGKILKGVFQKEAKKRPLKDKLPIDTFKVLSERVLYSVSNKRDVFFDNNYDFSIFVDKENNLSSKPLFNRSIYLKNIDSIQQAPLKFPQGIQSVGVAIPDDEIDSFSNLAVKHGALRITKIGTMSVYDTPWDGLLPLNRLVRWISVPI